MRMRIRAGIDRSTYLDFFQEAFPAPILMGYAGACRAGQRRSGRGAHPAAAGRHSPNVSLQQPHVRTWQHGPQHMAAWLHRHCAVSLSACVPAGRMSRDEFAAGQGFTVNLGIKDLGHMRALAADSGCVLPSADLAYGHLRDAAELGAGAMDWSALALPVRKAAGLQPAVQEQ